MAGTLSDGTTEIPLDARIRVTGARVAVAGDGYLLDIGGSPGGTVAAPAVVTMPNIFPIQNYSPALDGTTDDTAAWNEAITDASSAGGGIVQWFGAGVSIVNKVLLRDNVTLMLGEQSTLKLNPAAVADDFVLGNYDFVGGNTGLTVEGGRFDGNTAAFDIGPNITTLQFRKCPGLALRSCFVTGGPAEGVYIFDSAGVEIVNLTADACGIIEVGDSDGSGLHLDTCMGVRLSGVSLTNNGFHGLLLTGCAEVTGDVYAAHNHIDGVRCNAGYAITLHVTAVQNTQRGLYANLGTYGCSFFGSAIENGWHGVAANATYDTQFTMLSIDSGAGFYDVLYTLDTDGLSFFGRARDLLNEGPATNTFVTEDASGAIAAHVAEADPHVQYHNDARGDARYSLLAHVHTFASLTAKPTDLAGYGITDAASDAELAAHEADTTAIHGIANTASLVLTGDSRLSDARTPTAHAINTAGGFHTGTLDQSQQHAQTAYRDAAAGQTFANAQKIVTLLNLGSQSAGTGLVIGDQTAVLDAGGLTSGFGFTIYNDVASSASLVNFVARGTGTGVGNGIANHFNTTVANNLKRAGAIRWAKNGAWTNGSAGTQGADIILLAGASGASVEVLRLAGPTLLATFAGGITSPGQIASTIVTGTAPLVVVSTTLVANLTAQNLGASGQDSAYHLALANATGTLTTAKGGTGADGSALAASRVLISPAAGGGAAYRLLVTADLPADVALLSGAGRFTGAISGTGAAGVRMGTIGGLGGFYIDTGGDGWSVFGDAIDLHFEHDSGLALLLSADGVGGGSFGGMSAVDVSVDYKVNATRVVNARKTGWATATGTATRTTFDTATVTLAQLAERVKAMVDDLHSTAGHGLIGA